MNHECSVRDLTFHQSKETKTDVAFTASLRGGGVSGVITVFTDSDLVLYSESSHSRAT